MKLSPFLWGALAVLAVLVLYGHWRDTRMAEADKAYQRTLDTLNLRIQMQDAEGMKMQSENARWQATVDSLVKASPALPPEVAPIAQAHAPNGTSSDSVTYWHARADTLERVTHRLMNDNHALREYGANRDAQIQALGHLLALSQASDSLHTAQRDSALAIANRAPVTHKRGFTVLGIRLCPTAVAGYGAMLGGVVRTGASVTVGQPLLGCGD